MKLASRLKTRLSNFFIQYPAVVSGIIIYAYLLFTLIRYFIKFKAMELHGFDAVQLFDALPFMWLLAYALVKIIELRNKYLISENYRLKTEQEVLVKDTQLATMRSVSRAFQHRVNTPLTIMTFELGAIRKIADANPHIVKRITVIESALSTITQAMLEYSHADIYSTKEPHKY